MTNTAVTFAQEVAHVSSNGSVRAADTVDNKTRRGIYIVLRHAGLNGTTVWFVGIDKTTGEDVYEVVGP